MPIRWQRYEGGFNKSEGVHYIGLTWPGTTRVMDTDRSIRFTTKQLLTCGVVGASLLCCGVVFALPYLAKLIK